MSATIVRFRCYRCDQLLGVSAAKAGRTATCPRCQAELLVPEPEIDEAVEAQAPKQDQEPQSIPPAVSATEPAPASNEPTAFPIRTQDTTARLAGDPLGDFDLSSIEIAPTRLVDPVIRRESSASSISTDAVAPFSADLLLAPPEKAPFVPDDTVAAEIRIDPPRVLDREVASRRSRTREISLSPSVVTAWMFFVLLGLVLSFVGGLLVGHYLWIKPTIATHP